MVPDAAPVRPAGGVERTMKRRPQNTRADGPVSGRDAVLYVRVSSKEQEKEGFSIPAQQKLLREYAETHGFNVVQEFEDIETAKRTGRPGFDEMVSFLQAASTACCTLLVEKTDRLYRNIKDWVTVADLDIDVHLVKEGVVLSEDSRSSEKFMHGIRVLMAKNYIDNLSEEVRKGMREKAEQGHWPTVAHVGFLNNLETHRIEVDPLRGPLVARLFERYAQGDVSLKEVTRIAGELGLTHPRSVRRLVKSEVHRILRNPIYAGEFLWKGKRYTGLHQPIISMALFEQVQDVFEAANRPKYTKRRHAFTGLVSCGRCGCAVTAEIKKGRYVYYHCTGGRGSCGNTYVREEELSRLFADVVKRIQVPIDVANWIAEALRESQSDKERYHRTAVMQLQQRYLAIQAKLDKAYDDRLGGRISDELWLRKSGEWEAELASTRRETARHERASHDYAATGSKILELAKSAHNLFIRQDPREQARLLKTLVSNSTFDRGSLSVTYVKPFDLLADGNETGDWLGGRDSGPERREPRRAGNRAAPPTSDEVRGGGEGGIQTPIPWSRVTCSELRLAGIDAREPRQSAVSLEVRRDLLCGLDVRLARRIVQRLCLC
ncbi:MAG: recombinase family protein [Luteitalea sp.]|nr:recombinase family protein [Luteitalea sp.]